MAFFDDEKEHDGEPHKKAPAVTQNLGPLPVWGWGIVAIAAVFLWRRIAGGGSSSSSGGPAASGNGFSAPYPSGGSVGGIFLLPNSGSANAQPTPPSTDAQPAQPATQAVPWVFVRGGEGGIWGRELVNNQWTPWQNFGGTAAPNTVPVVSGNTLFAQGIEGDLWGRTYDPTANAWSDWVNMNAGGKLTSGPGGGYIYTTPGTNPGPAVGAGLGGGAHP